MCLAVPGKIVEVIEDPEPAFRRGKVDFSGVRKDVSLAFTPEAKVGDYVLVHVGFALNVVDEEEAQKIFEHLDQIAAFEEMETDPSVPGETGEPIDVSPPDRERTEEEVP